MVNTCQLSARDDQENFATRLLEVETKFSEYRDTAEREAKKASECVFRDESEMKFMQREMIILRSNVEKSDQLMGALREQMHEALSTKSTAVTTERRIRDAEESISVLKTENDLLSQRAKSICSRYEIGDLVSFRKTLLTIHADK